MLRKPLVYFQHLIVLLAGLSSIVHKWGFMPWSVCLGALVRGEACVGGMFYTRIHQRHFLHN